MHVAGSGEDFTLINGANTGNRPWTHREVVFYGIETLSSNGKTIAHESKSKAHLPVRIFSKVLQAKIC